MLNIDFFQILLHMLNFVILAGALSLLLFKPVNKFLEERKAYYEKLEKENEENRIKNEQTRAEYEARQAQTEELIGQRKLEAEKEMTASAKACIGEAKQKAAAILASAERDAEIRKNAILESAQTELGELVVMAAQKLLNNTESPERNSELYDEYIPMAEKSKADTRNSK